MPCGGCHGRGARPCAVADGVESVVGDRAERRGARGGERAGGGGRAASAAGAGGVAECVG